MTEQPPAGNPQSVTELPEFWQGEITRARDDAAKYRTERNALRDQLGIATEKASKFDELSEKYEQSLTSVADSDSKYGKLSAVLGAIQDTTIPAHRALTLASRVQGATAEEWAADAKSLVDMFSGSAGQPRRPIDPSQGQGHVPLNDGDALTEALKNALG
ncbi:hypothetical protein FPZ12_029555 [Amycolatopsis acidicola]|uniref:Scaffolding protein n=1 Tax=Amycolatopsis acidicola TaxID=2596893 RepID=A0A5N0UV84_9PSEU|nr:hypothetical protein [Amycolatopsis acidicola]KAA9155544.1 hypothetical protein FPZ12_029555 [Amycolatopsis acidicola]